MADIATSSTIDSWIEDALFSPMGFCSEHPTTAYERSLLRDAAKFLLLTLTVNNSPHTQAVVDEILRGRGLT